MEFYLVPREHCVLQLVPGRTSTLAFCVKSPFQNACRTPADANLFRKFEEAFDAKFGEQDDMWPLTMELFPKENSAYPSQPSNERGIILTGNILKALHQVLQDGGAAELLTIEVVADLFCGRPPTSFQAASIKANDFFPSINENGSVDHRCYVHPAMRMSKFFPTGSWYVSVKVCAERSFVSLEGVLPKLEETNRKIYEDKRFCDFTLVSEDGTRIPCHKAFLAKSPVLGQMLEGDFQEGRNNEMRMRTMSTAGVNAFLEFLYCNEVPQAMVHGDIALELLIAAEMYDLEHLWRAMATIVGAKPHSWFEVDVALKLFDFGGKCHREEGPRLRKKMIQVLALKPEQLSRSTLFAELFSSPVSRELFNAALEANRP